MIKNGESLVRNVESLELSYHTSLGHLIACLMNSLTAKLDKYGLGRPSLKIIHLYLTTTRQRVKVNIM